MKNKAKLIGDDFHFEPQRPSIRCAKEAIEFYKFHEVKGDNWLYDKENGLPIFLDTNVLLDLYRTSIRSRNQFLKFLHENKERIFITWQVNKEYLRNRVRVINSAIQLFNRAKEEANNLIDEVTDGNKKIKNKLSDWLAKRGFEKDLPENVRVTMKEIEKIVENILSEEVQKKISDAHNIISKGFDDVKNLIVSEYDDNILAKIIDVNSLNPLSEEELNYIRELYENLFKEAGIQKEEKEINDYYAFPGRGDSKKREQGLDPSGDLVIYHEILKFMDTNETNAIFLTGDVTKKDWVKSTGFPYSHYIIDNYYNTRHVIYIVDYQRCNFDIRPIEIESIPSNTEKVVEKDSSALEVVKSEVGDLEDKKPEIESSENSTIDLLSDTKSTYEKITEHLFVDELTKSLRWAKTYGNGYISLNFFIKNILANKGYDMRASFDVKDKLLEAQQIVVEDREDEGHKFQSIQLADMGEIEKSQLRSKKTKRQAVVSAPTVDEKLIEKAN